MARFCIHYLRQEIPIASAKFVMGRSPDCELPLDDEEASRQHAVLHLSAEGLSLEDLGSKNGVLVNGVRVEGTVVVRHGDRLTIGKQVLLVVEMEEQARRAGLTTMDSSRRATVQLRPRPESDPVGKMESLSERERQVLVLIARGHTHKEIAVELDVSVKTVETYRARLGEKLGVKTRAELVDCAIRAGLLSSL